jgi:hypothetical protein
MCCTDGAAHGSHAYHPSNPADPSPIDPGETAQLKNAQTGKYCRIAQLPAGYPLNKKISSNSGTSASAKKGKGRHLRQTPASCATQGVLCDQHYDNGAGWKVPGTLGNAWERPGIPGKSMERGYVHDWK